MPITQHAIHQSVRAVIAVCFIFALGWHAKAHAACEEALVRAAYEESSSVHTDYRLATLVTQSDWDQASRNAGASAELFGVPIGASYGDYHEAAMNKSQSLSESYSHDQLLSIAWSGLDPNATNVYRACLENTVMQANGLQAAIIAANQSDITILVHWFVPGEHRAARVRWLPKETFGAKLPNAIPQGYTALVVDRPKDKPQSLTGNYRGYTTGVINLYPYIPPPPSESTPAPPAHPAGWYGFTNSPNIDRENELRAKCTAGAPFTRVPAAGDFAVLCHSVSLQCKFVCDWEGHTKNCNENPNDGSRLARCN
jgi:hypothetical protein